MRRYFTPLYCNLRKDLKAKYFDLNYVAKCLGVSRRALDMKFSNIKGSTFRVDEMYALLDLLGVDGRWLNYYFPKEEIRYR